MSSEPKPVIPEVYDPKHIDLVNKITEKTRAKKIVWNKTATGMTASVSGKIEIGFVRSSGGLGGPQKWALFTIRDEKGNEILRVDNTYPNIRALLAQKDETLVRLRKAIEILYDNIEGIGREDLSKVIDLIESI